MVVLAGVTSSWTGNPQVEWLSAVNYQLMDKESRTEECDSAGNYKSKDKESTREIGLHRKLLTVKKQH
jgi:hypothetical protein